MSLDRARILPSSRTVWIQVLQVALLFKSSGGDDARGFKFVGSRTQSSVLLLPMSS